MIYLNRLMPLEGGLYQWAKLGFGELVGFLVAWNLWLYVIVLTSEIGLQVATNLSYALGPDAAWLAGSKWFIALAGSGVISGLMVVSALGLGVGKWIHNAGGLTMLLLFAALLALPIASVAGGHPVPFSALARARPEISLLSVNILAKLGFGALGGFEYVAILAGECKDPVRSISRSVLIAAPIIAFMFILGTSSVLFFVPPDEIDLIGPVPQVLSLGARPYGPIVRIVPLAILAVLGVRVAQASVNFTANTRLPMVTGWDRLLPQWFTRLDPRHRTPINSILFVGLMTLAMGIAGGAGVGQQEAYQLLQNAAGSFYALSYLVMFALPLFGLKGVEPRPPLLLKIAALSGLVMTLLYVVLSTFPIVKVESRASFATKIAGVILLANGVGTTFFFFAAGRRRAEGIGAPPDRRGAA